MPSISQADTRNAILSRLTPDAFQLIAPKLTWLDLPVRFSLERSNRAIACAVFVEHGIVSVVVRGTGDNLIEIGLIGREGMTGIPLVLGTGCSPNDAYVQAAGGGWSISAADLQGAMTGSLQFLRLCQASAHAFFVQTAHTALANGRGTIDQRLARWLLMAQDRMESADLSLTHEFLATMLGVRRPGVTSALGLLVKKNLIEQVRGKIAIRNRDGLLTIAGGFYGVPEGEHLRLFGADSSVSRRVA